MGAGEGYADACNVRKSSTIWNCTDHYDVAEIKGNQ